MLPGSEMITNTGRGAVFELRGEHCSLLLLFFSMEHEAVVSVVRRCHPFMHFLCYLQLTWCVSFKVVSGLF